MDLSVVIPTYNGAWCVGEAIASVAAQSVVPTEVVVVDDCSTDETCEVVLSSARGAPLPVRLFRRRCNWGGPARPMNEGFRRSRGRFVTVLDQDDLLAPNAVETYDRVVRASFTEQVGLVTSDFMTFDDQGLRAQSLFARQADLMPYFAGGASWVALAPDHARRVLARNWSLPFKGVFPRKVWEQVGGIDESFTSAGDCDFVRRVARNFSVIAVNAVLVHVRVHARHLSGSDHIVAPELIRVYDSMLLDAQDREERRLLSLRIRKELADLIYGYYKSRRFFRMLPFALSLVRRRVAAAAGLCAGRS